MTIIVTKGTLDWAYPAFILATTAAAMGVDVTMYFTFYGLPLLLKKLDLEVTPLGNPAMKMPMMGMHMAMPNLVGMLPGVKAGATTTMKNLIKKKGVASIEDLRQAAIESDVKMIACQMAMDLFEYKMEDMIEGPILAGAATYQPLNAMDGRHECASRFLPTARAVLHDDASGPIIPPPCRARLSRRGRRARGTRGYHRRSWDDRVVGMRF